MHRAPLRLIFGPSWMRAANPSPPVRHPSSTGSRRRTPASLGRPPASDRRSTRRRTQRHLPSVICHQYSETALPAQGHRAAPDAKLESNGGLPGASIYMIFTKSLVSLYRTFTGS
ncbi:MAG: hypothetical protein HSCHL_0347 [Hydrogenibacillus schlegelii]|uniref:Uncharacterized protein n=1 Tax=Hydrogenibacillus schlegelii TaxID=1484 RepID=A0A2T5GE15_HYDSH|nr:MAG: hypothetical protein HSCHL_0347 [Hydrogenibacillus schlegelii]